MTSPEVHSVAQARRLTELYAEFECGAVAGEASHVTRKRRRVAKIAAAFDDVTAKRKPATLAQAERMVCEELGTIAVFLFGALIKLVVRWLWSRYATDRPMSAMGG